MGSLFGILLKRNATGAVALSLARLQERYEVKAILQGESKEKQIEHNLERDFLKHTIEGIAVDMKNANDVAEKVADQSYKLVMHDLIMFKTLIANIEEIIDTNEHIERNKLVGESAVKKIRKEEKEFEEDLTYIKNKLNKDTRPYLEELYNAAETGKAAVLLGFERTKFLDWKLINYIRMRQDIGISISHISRLQKNIKELEEMYDKIKNGKINEQEIDKFILLEKKSVKDARKSAVHFFDLLKKNCIITYITIKIIRGELEEELKAIKGFEMPAVMYQADEQKKKHLLNAMAQNFRVEHKGVLELLQKTK